MTTPAEPKPAHCGSRPKKIAFGIAPLGVISIGIVPMGVVAIGVVPMGVVSLGAVAMGVITGSVVGMGVLTAGVSTMGVWFVGSDAGSMGLVRLGPGAKDPYHGSTPHPSRGGRDHGYGSHGHSHGSD